MNTQGPPPTASAPPSRGLRARGESFAARPPFAQRGALIPLFVIALIPLLAMVGLALDMGHLYLNRTRLQGTADAIALSAAKNLNDLRGNSLFWGTTLLEATNVCEQNWGYSEFDDPCAFGALDVTYSNTLPFSAGTSPGQFIRVALPTFSQPSWFIQVLNLLGNDFTNVNIAPAIAVAGPTSRLAFPANIVPWLACDGTPPVLTDPPRVLAGDSACSGNSCIANDYKNATYQDGIAMAWAALYTSPPNQTQRTNFYNALATRIQREPPSGRAPNSASLLPPATYNFGGTAQSIYPNNLGYNAYKSSLNTALFDSHPRVITVPVVACTAGAPDENPAPIIQFGCFFIREACQKRPIGNGCVAAPQPTGLSPKIGPPPGGFSFEYLPGCLNQGTAPVAGGTPGSGPYTIVLYPAAPPP